MFIIPNELNISYAYMNREIRIMIEWSNEPYITVLIPDKFVTNEICIAKSEIQFDVNEN